MKEVPTRLVVVGAGATGLEFAQAFGWLGSEVTLLDAAQPLADHDAEAVDIVLAQLERAGIVIRSGVKIVHVSYIAHSVAVTVEVGGAEEMIEGSHLLVCAGRKPLTDGLALDAAKIKHDVSGVLVDGKLRTSNRRVYAIGDSVAGAVPSVQEAEYQASLVLGQALGYPVPRKSLMPRAVFIEPELAQAGMTEAEARRRRFKIRILRGSYYDNGRAQAERATHGQFKVICDRKGQILGATIVGAQAAELIAPWNLAVAQGVNIRAMAEQVPPYPTYSEIGKNLAMAFTASRLTRSWVRRIIASLRVFG